MIKLKTFIIFVLIFIFSCKREILTPEKIPERTVLQDEPIANLSIPSKDATLKITPYMLGNTKRTYGHADKFFKFKDRYYVLFYRRYQYNANDVTEIPPGGNWHLIEFDVKTMSLVKTATNLESEHIGVYQKLNDIADGKNAYEDKDKIYVVENDKYYSSSDLVNWQTNNLIFDKKGKIEREKVDTARIKIGNYTYVYTGGGLQFSISRLEKRMRQQASRLETKFDFKPYDFNNLHMFDIGLNENGSTKADFRINPTNYINNNTDYEWIGMHNPHQVWLMPVEHSGKEYLIRFVEYCTELYLYEEIIKEMEKYKKEYQNSLVKALSYATSNKSAEQFCYEAISNNAEYKARNYFIEEAKKANLKTNGKMHPNKPITHYVIEIVDIE